MQRPRFKSLRLLLSVAVSILALEFAAFLFSGVTVRTRTGALVLALIVAAVNAVVPPLVAALRVRFTALLDFVALAVIDVALLWYGSRVSSSTFAVDSRRSAVFAALVVAAAVTVLHVVLSVDDDDTYAVRVVQRLARRERKGRPTRTGVPGILFLAIDGLATPVLQRAMRDGSAPTLARWLAEGSHRLMEWETDLASQTAASQAGILLGGNLDISADRWMEKEHARLITCATPAGCAEIERRLGNGDGLLAGGGSSRGNLFGGGARDVDRDAGRRAYLSNGYNLVRTVVLGAREVLIDVVAALRARLGDVQPRMPRGVRHALHRAAVCVLQRDIVVHGVLSDMMRGVPAVYATFTGYDDVAHRSGLERADTMAALRGIDRQLGRIARARGLAPRPYEIVVLSDHGQTQGATFLQRNGYSLADLVGSALRDDSAREVVVLGSGNLGLVYLMESPRRLSFEEIEERHPLLVESLRCHPHVGWLLVHTERHGPVVLGPHGLVVLGSGRVVGSDPLAVFSPNAAAHLRRADGFSHVADIVVGSFYDPQLDEGCAFEESICFHGGIGGAQTRPFVLAPGGFDFPATQPIGAAAMGALLRAWRASLQTSSPAWGEAPSPSHSRTWANGAPPVGTGRERPLPPSTRF